MRAKNSPSSMGWVAVILLIYGGAPRGIAGAENYYQGKTVTILGGGTPGGYGDLQARALMPYLKKYIPGEGCDGDPSTGDLDDSSAPVLPLDKNL